MNKGTMRIPKGHENSVFVVSASGGKDSTAVILAMREAGIPARYVYADTGWEVQEVYDYLATLERLLGITIERVGHPGGMVAKIRQRANFPSRMTKWCTGELKRDQIRKVHERIREEEDTDTVSVLGIRAEESAARADMPEFEYVDKHWGGYVWRPIMGWTVEDVLAIHHRHGVPVNPLYRLGFGRVGCMPCIFANKSEVKLMAEHFPERIDLIRSLEAEVTQERARRMADGTADHAHAQGTFFMGKKAGEIMPIDKVVAWSRTSRGGVQLNLLQEAPDSGCYRWGMCEPPAQEPKE